MESALYDPQHGYYFRPEMTLGSQGDFITAPEVSFLFGASIAHSILGVLKACQNPCVLELGAGSGKLAIDLLRELKYQDCLPEKYFILERSGSLKKLQQENLKKALPDFYEKIIWLDRLPEDKNNENNFFEGVILSNEVCDALPVKIFKKKENKIFELCVEFLSDIDGFCRGESCIRPASEDLKQAVLNLESELGEFPENYQSEICLILKPWIKSLSQVLKKGMILTIDYGYPRSEYYSALRSTGTLLCYYQHKAYEDPFVRIGQQDITAHVDFTNLAEAGIEAGLDLWGYCSQMMFLADAGIENLSQKISDVLIRRNALTQLMHPSLMGEQFKVMALGKKINPEELENFQGFRLQDDRHRL